MLHRKHRAVIGFLIVAGFLAVVGWFSTLRTSDGGKARKTQIELVELQSIIYNYFITQENDLPENISDLLSMLNRDPESARYLQRLPLASRGIDAWGRPLLCRRIDEGHFIVYSCGLNGIDDGGYGDDVRLSIEVLREAKRGRGE